MSSPFQIEVLERAKAAPYAQLFHECSNGLAQQSLEWSDVIAPISPDRPYFLVVRNMSDQTIIAGLPLYHFKGELGNILTSVPHAGPLGGIICTEKLGDVTAHDIYQALIKRATQMAEEFGCIALTIITHPFLDDAGLYWGRTPPNYVLNNFCQVVDLKSIFDDSGAYNTGKSSYNSHIRRNLSKAYEAGVTVQWGEEQDFDLWYEIHRERHSQLGAQPLPESLLKGVVTKMKTAGLGNLAVAKMKETVIGGCAYIWNKEVVDAYMPSGDSNYLKYGINYVAIDFGLRQFAKQGFKWFNWQSCSRNSGVYDFKKRWGSVEKTYKFLTWTFAGFEKVLEAGKDRISKAYQWHYLAPFEAIENRLTHGEFEKN